MCSTIRNASASWNTTRTEVTRGIWRDVSDPVLSHPTLWATTIESERTRTSMETPNGEEVQSQTSARMHGDDARDVARGNGMQRRGKREPAGNQCGSTEHHASNNPAATDDRANHDAAGTDQHTADATNDKSAQRGRTSKASSNRGSGERLVRVQRSQVGPDQRREGADGARRVRGRRARSRSRHTRPIPSRRFEVRHF